jgi:hypothetical protein
MKRHGGKKPSRCLTILAAAVVSGVAAWTACADGVGPVLRAYQIDSTTITASELPNPFDSTRTFAFRFPGGRADSLLVALFADGFDVVRAWRPLDNRCADPVGPLFTVELAADDPTILGRDFVRGEGRLACASLLVRYSIR